MATKIFSATINGLDAELIEVEVEVSAGLPTTIIVGLADTSIKECKERIRAALKNSIFKFPLGRITVNLAPANIFKYGTHFDLPIALAILRCSEQIKFNSDECIFFGELSLQGEIKPVQGILPFVLQAKEAGFKKVFLPLQNVSEAQLVESIEVIGIKDIAEVIRILEGQELPKKDQDQKINLLQQSSIDFADIVGQRFAKRGLEIAIAGGHNILMNGAPGTGKTMLAEAALSILPNLSGEELLQTAKVYSIHGSLKESVNLKPFRNPDRGISITAFVGGGRIPKPGEISLAHNGILFLDELPEFPRSLIESLREPLERGRIKISRMQSSYIFPSRFILIAAQNPCPCGYYNIKGKDCVCSAGKILAYQRKISGPILDRIDIQINVIKTDLNMLEKETECSAVVLKRVEAARLKQKERAGKLNSKLISKEINKFCNLEAKASELLSVADKKYDFSARTRFRIIKLARTIADLKNSQNIFPEDIAEAIQFRIGD